METDYVLLEKGGLGRGQKPPGWSKYPCISLTKGGVSFNQAACDAYKLGARGTLLVFIGISDTSRKLAFRKPTTAEETEHAYSIKRPSGVRNGTVMANKQISERLPDCVGQTFRLILNAGCKVIEADLSPDNVVK